MVKEKSLFEINTWNRASDFFQRWASFPGAAFARPHLVKLPQHFGKQLPDLQDKHTWTFSCESWTNHCILSKSHQNHCCAQKNPEAFYFVNRKVAKAFKFHETREDLCLPAAREMLQVLFTHNMSTWLTCCSFSVQRYGDRSNQCPGPECGKAAFAAVLQLSLKKTI